MTKNDWRTLLEDSVSALGHAAREQQRAYCLAVMATQGMDVERLRIHDGVTFNQHQGHRGESMPHLGALASIQSRYLALEHQFQDDYETAARAYSWGAHWAALEILADRTPGHVVITWDPQGTPGLEHLPTLRIPGNESATEEIAADRTAIDVAESSAAAAAAAIRHGETVQRWFPAVLRAYDARRLAAVAPRQ